MIKLFFFVKLICLYCGGCNCNIRDVFYNNLIRLCIGIMINNDDYTVSTIKYCFDVRVCFLIIINDASLKSILGKCQNEYNHYL